MNGISFVSNDLSFGDFADLDLTNTNFRHASLQNADFAGALIRGTDFGRLPYDTIPQTGISLDQLYSTASYIAKDLSGIGLSHNKLISANFAGQYLANADFEGATLTGATFAGADTRGAFAVGGAITSNLIWPDGYIHGLDLGNGNSLVVRDYDGDPSRGIGPLPVIIDSHFAMAPGGTLRLKFEADDWGSTISFAPGIPVTLDGTLELTFAKGVNLATQRGRTFQIFNWAGVGPRGEFAISSPYQWDTSQLYTSGEVMLIAIPEPAGPSLAIAFALEFNLIYRRKRS